MKYLKILLIALCLVTVTPACGLLGAQDASGLVSGAAALAFDGAAVALQVLDQKEADYLDSLENPNLDDINTAMVQVGRLKRARDSLAIARGYLSGETSGDLKTAVGNAVKELLLVSEELQADGVSIPQTVIDGLNLAAKYAGVPTGDA